MVSVQIQNKIQKNKMVILLMVIFYELNGIHIYFHCVQNKCEHSLEHLLCSMNKKKNIQIWKDLLNNDNFHSWVNYCFALCDSD